MTFRPGLLVLLPLLALAACDTSPHATQASLTVVAPGDGTRLLGMRTVPPNRFDWHFDIEGLSEASGTPVVFRNTISEYGIETEAARIEIARESSGLYDIQAFWPAYPYQSESGGDTEVVAWVNGPSQGLQRSSTLSVSMHGGGGSLKTNRKVRSYHVRGGVIIVDYDEVEGVTMATSQAGEPPVTIGDVVYIAVRPRYGTRLSQTSQLKVYGPRTASLVTAPTAPGLPAEVAHFLEDW